MIILQLVVYTESRKKKGSKRKGSGQDDDFQWEGVYFVAFLAFLVTLPAFVTFTYRVWNDPITPTLIVNARQAMVDKTTGYLSSRQKNKAATKYN